MTGTIAWDASTSAYTQCIWSKAQPAHICTKVGKKVENGEVFTDVYFVVEHQPTQCTQYPANGNVVFQNISVAWEGGNTTPDWSVQQYKPACNSNGKVIDAQTLEFTWDTK